MNPVFSEEFEILGLLSSYQYYWSTKVDMNIADYLTISCVYVAPSHNNSYCIELYIR